MRRLTFRIRQGFFEKNRLNSRHFSGSAAQRGEIASYVKQKCRF